jgi:hypothetical protein
MQRSRAARRQRNMRLLPIIVNRSIREALLMKLCKALNQFSD